MSFCIQIAIQCLIITSALSTLANSSSSSVLPECIALSGCMQDWQSPRLEADVGNSSPLASGGLDRVLIPLYPGIIGRRTYLASKTSTAKDTESTIFISSSFCQVLFYPIGGSGPSAPIYQISATPCLCYSTIDIHHVSDIHFWRAFVFLSCTSLLEPVPFLPRTLIFLA